MAHQIKPFQTYNLNQILAEARVVADSHDDTMRVPADLLVKLICAHEWKDAWETISAELLPSFDADDQVY